MDNLLKKDDPGDCQSGSSNENDPMQNENLNTSIKAVTTAEQKTTKPAAAAAAVPTVAVSKLKSNQQLYQFRAPQQFVKQKRSLATAAGHSKSCSSTAATFQNALRKQKCWNKRQNKIIKQQNNTNANISTIASALSNAASGNSTNEAEQIGEQHAGSVVQSAAATNKADLENIQNIKNEIIGHQHSHHYQQHATAAGIVGGSASANINESRVSSVFPPCLNLSNEKLLYGHGPKQQLQHKKLLSSHRGGHNHNNHHHVLCAGSAHNTLSSGGNNGIGTAASLASISCCHINGCGSHLGKDNSAPPNNNSTGNSSSLHFCCLRSKFFLPDKRPPRKGNFIPPTKFLLGGNISDPLNLSSLQNEASNASSNHTTPRQSPITTPPKVEVIIPPNIHDPLHLLDPVDSMEYEKQLTSPMKRGGVLLGGLTSLALSGLRGPLTLSKAHKHRHRNKRKPKRKRNDSYNSTTSTVGDSLDEEPHFSFAKGDELLSSGDAMETTVASCSTADAVNDDKKAQTIGDAAAEVEKQTKVAAVENETPSQIIKTHTDEVTIEATVTAIVSETKQHAIESAAAITVSSSMEPALTKERLSRDLRLDLSATTAAGSIPSCGIFSSTGIFGGYSRKRKVSESNSSQKSKHFRVDSMDKIVSPVVPQPGAWKRPPRTTASGARKSISRRSTSISESITTDLSPVEETAKQLTEDLSKIAETPNDTIAAGSPLSNVSATTSVNTAEPDANSDLNSDNSNALNLAENVKTELLIVKLNKSSPQLPKFCPDGGKYRYGNFDRYAGLRHLNEFMDVRLHVFLLYPELFKSKDILDIGCNVGHMTIAVASKLAPKSILGIDIDKDLISRARRNLTMYVRLPYEVRKKESERLEETKESEIHPKKGRRRRRKKRPHNMEQQQQQQQQPQHHHQINFNHWQQFHQHFVHYHLHHHHRLQEELNVQPDEFFPISFPLTYGAVAKPNCLNAKVASPHNQESQSPASSSTTTRSTPGHPAARSSAFNTSVSMSLMTKPGLFRPTNDFPNNVYFRQTNYVLKDESLLANDSQQYDLILCLSVTKWIHLNFGDAGLKLAFKRMFNQLRPGGKLILEAQNWASYKKKKNLTEDIYNNYNNIEFFPNKFHEYLLSSEVGFSHSYSLGVPKHLSKGFSRPIQLYAKGDYTPNHVRWSDAYYPQTPFEAYKGIYATLPPRPTGLQSSYPIISSTRSQNYDTPSYYVGGGGGGGASAPYSCRQTPMHQPSTSQYYNPLESDSYQPSYDMEYLNHMYVFASPLYQTVWSPPTSMRKSSSHTPVFGSVRDPEFEGTGSSSQRRHVYPPNEDTSSPNSNAVNAFNSIRDPDTDDSNQHRPHVYAANCVEASSSPHPNMEPLDDALILDDEQQHQQQPALLPKSNNCDLSEA